MSQRGTQSFVLILSACWRRPGLLLREVAWRWLFGLPALLLLAYCGIHIYRTAYAALISAGMDQFTLENPDQAALIVAQSAAVLRPVVTHLVVWLAPLLMVGWSVASGVGRNVVLRRYDAGLPWRPFAISVLQLLRLVALAATFALWYASVHWSAGQALGTAGEPNLVLYFALVICFSLGIFSLWSLLSWIFYIAPLLLLLEKTSIPGALGRSLRLGSITGKLVEVNLVMGIVKLALIVLAMVFSAIPLPFVSGGQGASLYLWWAAVTLLYMVASDFFQLARVVAFVQFWKAAHPGPAGAVDLR
jgi:hypothetical protein